MQIRNAYLIVLSIPDFTKLINSLFKTDSIRPQVNCRFTIQRQHMALFLKSSTSAKPYLPPAKVYISPYFPLWRPRYRTKLFSLKQKTAFWAWQSNAFPKGSSNSDYSVKPSDSVSPSVFSGSSFSG